MYSVEDLLISHGYKVPKNPPAPRETAGVADCRRETAKKGSGHGTANGHEVDVGTYACSKQPSPEKSYADDNEHQDRNQRREAGIGNQGDTQPTGDFLTRESGVCDRTSGMKSHPRDDRDVSYWRRRGQDFSVLLDYSDCGEARGSVSTRAPEDARMSSGAERGHARQRREEAERMMGRDQRRPTGDWKCQSLRKDERRPAVALGPDGEHERKAQGQIRNTASDGGVDPRTKGKSLSLPRVLSPESLQYVSLPTHGQSTYGAYRLNGSLSHRPPQRHHDRDWWSENGHWPSGHGAPLPKPRFSRPIKPPSYEVHQQTWGSSEMLAGDRGLHPREKGPCVSRQDSFSPGMDPPVYIPPPSYERPQLHRGTLKNYSDMSNYRLKEASFQVGPHGLGPGRWISIPVGGSWLEQPRHRNAPCKGQVHSGFSPNNIGWVEYLPFDDPRVRHISGAPCGSALRDADKIRRANKEFPSAQVAEQSTVDSALPPMEGLYFSTETDKRTLNELNDANRFPLSDFHKESGKSIASNQNSNEHQKDCSPSYQTRSSGQSTNLEQAIPETITQVKKIEPGIEGTKKQSSKKRVNETIFCLVSVPLQLQPNTENFDQNNNQKPDQSNLDQGDSKHSGEHQHSQPNTSPTELELPALSETWTGNKSPKMQASHQNNHKELLYSGSWPGDQYRDQETQTSCPAAPKRAPQDHLQQPAQVQGPSTTNTTVDNGVGGGYNTFGYLMKGQKGLNPSSNSAFSRTANFPIKHRKTNEQRAAPSGSPKRSTENPVSGTGQEAFGQFLLKPVGRRPWDAIEELESFNKELQLQIGKRPSVDLSIEDLDQACRDMLQLSTSSDNLEIVKAQDFDYTPVKREPSGKPNTRKTQHAVGNWRPAGDVEHGIVRSAFSRPPAKADNFQKLPNDPDFSTYDLLSHTPLNVEADCSIPRSDIPVLQESLLKDVGLTVYTEVPNVVAQPTQDFSTLTSSPDCEDDYQTLLLSHKIEPATEYKARNSDTTQLSTLRTCGLRVDPVQREPLLSRLETERKVNKKNLVLGFGRENTLENKGQGDEIYCLSELPDFTRPSYAADSSITEEVLSVSDEGTLDHFDWQKQLSLAEKHLEELLINEKANSLPKEDLSNLYEVQCAEGIPEKETIEERAARILGIEVPAESLALGDQKPKTEDPEVKIKAEPRMTQEHWECNADRKPLKVQSQCEKVHEESLDLNGLRQEEEEMVGPKEGTCRRGTLERQPSSVAISNSEEKLSLSVSGDVQGCDSFLKPEVLEAEALDGATLEAESLEDEVLETPTLEAEVMDLKTLELEALEIAAPKPEVPVGEPWETEVQQVKILEPQALEIRAPKDGMVSLFCPESVENLVLQEESSYVSHAEDLVIGTLNLGEESTEEEEWNMDEKGNFTLQLGPKDSLLSAVPAQPRNAFVTKREITLPLNLSEYAHEAEYLDEDVEEDELPFSDSYDPSRVERV
ncbi:hypothetical protein GJAV_G00083380 [Gymnothorax javanicus]|nr:hypothetical protein GJAV_G00083380 [Gymnothorax javanicus]